MFNRLKKSILNDKNYAEDVKLYDSDKFFAMRDASARCVCSAIVEGRLHAAFPLLVQYVILDKEVQRRCEEV